MLLKIREDTVKALILQVNAATNAASRVDALISQDDWSAAEIAASELEAQGRSILGVIRQINIAIDDLERATQRLTPKPYAEGGGGAQFLDAPRKLDQRLVPPTHPDAHKE